MDTRKTRAKKKPPAVTAEHVTEEELRPLVALWIATMRNRLTALTQEFERVKNAATEGSVLARVIDAVAVNDVWIDLSNADNEALALSIVGDELPVPDLLGALAKPTA